MYLKQYVFNTIGCNNPNVHFLFSLATPQKKPFNIIKDKNKSYFFSDVWRKSPKDRNW